MESASAHAAIVAPTGRPAVLDAFPPSPACSSPRRMQIVANTSTMPAGVTVVTDKHGHDWCIVVVKGTFVTDDRGAMRLAREQRPLVYVDEHYGDPEKSAIRYESEFAPIKPATDVLVVGKAVAPRGEATARLAVRLEVQGRTKDVHVVGERRWVRAAGGLVASDPVPFREMPLTFDRAFGGTDDSRGPTQAESERRNLAGVGFHPHRSARELDGQPLPNLEHPQHPIAGPRDRPPPVGLGVVGRAWLPRVSHAGTYDTRWRDEVCPLLPADFDDRYFQSAPADQQLPLFRGGELIRCVHMATDPVVQYVIPALQVPVRFRFPDRDVDELGRLDTVILEPHDRLALLLWRARVRLPKKLHSLREILVGEQPRAPDDGLVGYRDGRPIFTDLGAAVRWLRGHRRGGGPQ